MGCQNTTSSWTQPEQDCHPRKGFPKWYPPPGNNGLSFPTASKNRSVPRSCPCRQEGNFCANLIRKISSNGNSSHHRKSVNTPRLSRYACRACFRSSSVGAVLYLAYSSCRTSASSFCSGPGEFPQHSHRRRPSDTPPKPQTGHRESVHFHSLFLSATVASVALYSITSNAGASTTM